jgi:hypothetical protein
MTTPLTVVVFGFVSTTVAVVAAVNPVPSCMNVVVSPALALIVRRGEAGFDGIDWILTI